MLKNIFLGVLLLMISYCPAYAKSCPCPEGCEVKNVTGPVRDIKKDIARLYMFDEDLNENRDFFVHPDYLKSLKVGDRVRVYYECRDLPALSVKKLTPLPYSPQGQNGGFLQKK